MTSDTNSGVCLIRRVVIRNYKSIAACDVELGPLTFLVGPNGSGKSNFLDALRFVSDALRESLDHAIRARGGIAEVRRRLASRFGIRLEFTLPSGIQGHYAFEMGGEWGAYTVFREEGVLTSAPDGGGEDAYFEIAAGELRRSSLSVAPAAVPDRLYLVNLSGTPEFRPLYDALSGMRFYNLNPDAMRELQPPSAGEFLARDGSNLSSVFTALAPARKKRVAEYLAQITPGITGVETFEIGPRETLRFVQHLAPTRDPWRFFAANMSDGTLRGLGVLLALFQGRGPDENAPPLVGLEEPETALHPAATGVLIDSMRDAVAMRQILVTSHSPELLDNPSIADSEILAVTADDGQTTIGPLDEAGRSVLRDHLFTAGDLLRMNQLRPAPAVGTLDPSDVVLFGTGAPA